MPNCPVCQNADKIYMSGHDPRYGWYVLCWEHGIQSVELDDHKPKGGNA